jgi:hypothetical protein
MAHRPSASGSHLAPPPRPITRPGTYHFSHEGHRPPAHLPPSPYPHHRGRFPRAPVYYSVDYDNAYPYIYDYVPLYGLDLGADNEVPDWIGKKLIRRGAAIPPGVFGGDIVLEEDIPQPYQIIGPNSISIGYNPARLLIYVNSLDIIQRVIYG